MKTIVQVLLLIVGLIAAGVVIAVAWHRANSVT